MPPQGDSRGRVHDPWWDGAGPVEESGRDSSSGWAKAHPIPASGRGRGRGRGRGHAGPGPTACGHRRRWSGRRSSS